MGTISTSALTTILDSLASQKLIFDASVGTSSSQSNTVLKGAVNDVATITAQADNDVQADLASVFRTRTNAVHSTALYATLNAYNLWWVLDRHTAASSTAGVTGLDTFLNTNNIRVSPAVVALGFPLAAAQILPPSVDPMATFTVTGSGAGTYTHVANVDTTLYGRAWLQAVVTATVGATPIVAVVTGSQIDNTLVTKSATISANSSVGTAVNLGVLGVQADSFDAVTNIAITGGTAGDAFKVISRVERVITTTT